MFVKRGEFHANEGESECLLIFARICCTYISLKDKSAPVNMCVHNRKEMHIYNSMIDFDGKGREWNQGLFFESGTRIYQPHKPIFRRNYN